MRWRLDCQLSRRHMRRAAAQLSVTNALGNWQSMSQSIQTTQLSPQDAANIKDLKREKESKGEESGDVCEGGGRKGGVFNCT